jgi:hypothetical protein
LSEAGFTTEPTSISAAIRVLKTARDLPMI